MTHRPIFITFTGADDTADVDRMVALSARYPIEWGILFSESRRGTPRFPSLDALYRFEQAQLDHDLRLSAHLCGQHSRFLLELGALPIYRNFDMQGFLTDCCRRIQINTSTPISNIDQILRWAKSMQAGVILQCTGRFPAEAGVMWLFDASAGNGIAPKAWPRPRSLRENLLKGYAGGLNPDNVATAVAEIGAHDMTYWIDMGSGVRTLSEIRVDRPQTDVFDLDKCEAVCRSVYGEGAP